MRRTEIKQNFEAFCGVAEQFATCMNDYLYVYDIMNDTYFITEGAAERFALPGCLFHDVTENLRACVHPDDFPPHYSAGLNLSISAGILSAINMIFRLMGLITMPITSFPMAF